MEERSLKRKLQHIYIKEYSIVGFHKPNWVKVVHNVILNFCIPDYYVCFLKITGISELKFPLYIIYFCQLLPYIDIYSVL